MTGLTQEEMAELEQLQQEQQEDGAEDNFMLNQELQEMYGASEPEEKMNAHSFLHKAAFSDVDTTRTTFLYEGELGRPLFTVRFMLDMEDIAKFYLDPLIKNLGGDSDKDNAIANYFRKKVQNVTDSGMSNKGFSMNLNVTRKMDSTRQRGGNIENLKGGDKK